MSKVQELLKNAYENYCEEEHISYQKEGSKIIKTFKDTVYDILCLSYSLIHYDLLDKNILLIGKNSYEWIVSWTSIIGYVGVAIPIDNTWTLANLRNVLNQLEISCIMYSKDYEDISVIEKEYQNIKYFCIEEDIPNLIMEGKRVLDKQENKFSFQEVNDEMACELKVESAILKNVNFITHTPKNLLASFKYFNQRLPLTREDKIYTYLQMSDSYVSIYAYLYSFYTGTKIYFGTEADMFEELLEEKPTVFFGVPYDYMRILESYGEENVERLKKKISRNVNLTKFGIYREKEKSFKSFHQFLGGNMKYLVCYGNLSEKNIKKLYLDVGLKIQTLYGVSGATSLISFEYYNDKEVFSSGKVLENMDIKIYEPNSMRYGEIIIKGDNVTRCYYNNIQKTNEVFDYKGYFHTGDLGYIEKNNELFLVGNTQNKIMLDNGKTIYSDELEKIFYDIDEFATVNIYERKGVLNLNVVTNMEREKVDSIVMNINSELPEYMRIKEIHVKKNRLSMEGR
ncbi:MAG: AMP-binding protein [Clostridia bacterium]|nr:AMP-binding protein [Clostridia bacterium]